MAVAQGRSLKTLSLAALIALAVVTTGCSSASAPTSSATPNSASAVSVAAPTLQLTSPLEGAIVKSGDIKVAVKTTGLKFTMPSTTKVAGEGHVHFSLDGAPVKMSAEPQYVFTGVTPGPHELKAELVQNDATSLNPPVEQVVKFTAE